MIHRRTRVFVEREEGGRSEADENKWVGDLQTI